MHTVIETHLLTERYEDLTAVSELSLRVKPGEIYAFLGLNGAGKTTTIRMLLGMVKPTAGEVRVLGTPIRRGLNKVWNSVGYLVEIPYSYPELTVRENLDAIRVLRPGTDRSGVDGIIERLGLTRHADRHARVLSQGNAQRLGLAKALLHDPELLILDEPANGLDPAGIVEIRNLLLELSRERGVTIFMSSHILGEVSRLADRIGIIHEGRLLQELDADTLHRNRRSRLVIKTRDIQAAIAVVKGAGFEARTTDDHYIEMTARAAIERPETLNTLLVEKGHPPMMLTVEEEDLEAYFLRLIGIKDEAVS